MTDAAIEAVLRRDCAIVAAAFIVVTALAGSYALLVFGSTSLLVTMLAVFALAQGCALVGFNIMHDGAHESYAHSKTINWLMGGMLNVLGGSQLADLLRELAPGDREQVFVGSIRLTLRDRPMALVPAREERPAGMSQEKLQLAGDRAASAEQENARTLPEDHPRIVAEARHGARARSSTIRDRCDAPATPPPGAAVEPSPS